jgi:putative endonuclease
MGTQAGSGRAYRDAAQLELSWPAGVRRAGGRAAATPASDGTPAGQRQRHRRGWLSELAAAALLICKGYRLIGRRERTRCGEIDLIAVRGKRLAFVEVKYRRTIGEAAAAITGVQTGRIASAAENWVWRHPRYHHHEIGLDVVLVAPGLMIRHVANALQPA